MAFRIHDSVVRGEIDNRIKGIVRGKIWVESREEPLILDLKGNAWPDLAGCQLTFTNPQKRIADPHIDALDPIQRGSIGDLTASHKVRVFDVPLEKAIEMADRKESPPEHMANSLYLEWFSEANGRVVVESTDYILTISTPEWQMSPEENEERAKQAAAGMNDFMKKLTDAIEQHQLGQKDPQVEWDEHDYEKFLKESDARTDKYMELLDKYGDSEEAQAKIEQEMGWGGGENEDDEEGLSAEEMNEILQAAENEPLPEPDPQREGIDWIRGEEGEICHPLQHRCSESGSRFWQQIEQLGLDKSVDKDLEQCVCEFQITAAKLAGALNTFARGSDYPDSAFTVACLKRALDHLHKCQAGLEAVARKALLPEAMIVEVRKELFEIREGILQLMEDFRRRC